MEIASKDLAIECIQVKTCSDIINEISPIPSRCNFCLEIFQTSNPPYVIPYCNHRICEICVQKQRLVNNTTCLMCTEDVKYNRLRVDHEFMAYLTTSLPKLDYREQLLSSFVDMYPNTKAQLIECLELKRLIVQELKLSVEKMKSSQFIQLGRFLVRSSLQVTAEFVPEVEYYRNLVYLGDLAYALYKSHFDEKNKNSFLMMHKKHLQIFTRVRIHALLSKYLEMLRWGIKCEPADGYSVNLDQTRTNSNNSMVTLGVLSLQSIKLTEYTFTGKTVVFEKITDNIQAYGDYIITTGTVLADLIDCIYKGWSEKKTIKATIFDIQQLEDGLKEFDILIQGMDKLFNYYQEKTKKNSLNI